MSQVYFISDLHFNHTNLISNLRNMTVEENNSLIVQNWNKKVTKKDLVYLLGDFSMADPNTIKEFIPQLHGRIILIGGNHDNRQCCEAFKNLGIVVMGCLSYKGFICTHIPIHPLELNGHFRGNIHGHIHTSKVDYGPKYFNVCCELLHYTPISFPELLEQWYKRVTVTE